MQLVLMYAWHDLVAGMVVGPAILQQLFYESIKFLFTNSLQIEEAFQQNGRIYFNLLNSWSLF